MLSLLKTILEFLVCNQLQNQTVNPKYKQENSSKTTNNSSFLGTPSFVYFTSLSFENQNQYYSDWLLTLYSRLSSEWLTIFRRFYSIMFTFKQDCLGPNPGPTICRLRDLKATLSYLTSLCTHSITSTELFERLKDIIRVKCAPYLCRE